MQKCAMPRAKFAVPSIGSMTQTLAESFAAAFFADEGVLGEKRRKTQDHEAFDLAVDLRQIVLMTLEGELERGFVLETAADELAGLARDGLRADKTGI